MTEIAEKRFYIDLLKSHECQCGCWKARGKAFCYVCFKRLSDDLQRDIYLPLGGGFEYAYEECVKHLTN